MRHPSISVVIPAYNASATIGRAVGSVLSQTLAASQIVIVDDGSRDDLASALASLGASVTLIRKPNGGAASARNLGIDHCTGEFIAFLDADDYWEREKLERQSAVFDRHPEVALVASRNFNEQPGESTRDLSPDLSRWSDRVQQCAGATAFLLATKCWTSTVMVRREALAQERFESGLEPAEDRDLWVRLVARHPIYLLNEPLATAVLVPGSLSRTQLNRDCSNMLRVIQKYRSLLGRAGTRRWEAIVYRRWAGENLACSNSRRALPCALQRLKREPWSFEGWYIAVRAALGTAVGAFRNGDIARGEHG